MIRRRDRRGRGLRGPLAPAELPVSRTRSEQFDEYVLASLARLEPRWGEELESVEIVVADVPDADADPAGPVRLGQALPAGAGEPARIVVHRRAVEARAGGARARESLVHRVVVEQLAELLGLPPELVDPEADDEA